MRAGHEAPITKVDRVTATFDPTGEVTAFRPTVEHRISNPVKHQQLEQHRLRRHMLGSIPMCFNLFGEFSADLTRLTHVGRTLFGLNTQGIEVRFEWSPGRSSPEYTGDQTAFDV